MACPLRTARLTLLPLRRADLDDLVRLNADDGVMRYLDRTPPSRAAVLEWIEQAVVDEVRHPGHGRWRAEDVAGAFVGWFSLVVAGAGVAAPVLGYRLRRGAWGRGLATEGARLLVDRAFRHLDAERITAQTMAVNLASRGVLEKVGMRHTRTLHLPFADPLPGTEQGEVVYEIARRMWAEPQAAPVPHPPARRPTPQ